MTRRRTFTQYVHECEARDGRALYAVGEWDPQHAQYTRPFDVGEAHATGCSAEYSRIPAGLSNRYASRTRALRRARYLYYEMSADYCDFLAEEDALSTI